jgi:hypothetical protein
VSEPVAKKNLKQIDLNQEEQKLKKVIFDSTAKVKRSKR